MTNEKKTTGKEEELISQEKEDVALTEEEASETPEMVFAEEKTEDTEETRGTEEPINDSTSDLAEQLAELQAKNNELEKKLEEYENRYLRLQADFENFRRRARLDAEANEKYRAQKLIVDILPALDNFERALKMEANNEQASALLQGMEMVYRGLLDALAKEGLAAIEAVGKEFDPHLHQAVMQGEDANYASNIVIEEFQKGYMLKDRVIRPSMVKVNQ